MQTINKSIIENMKKNRENFFRTINFWLLIFEVMKSKYLIQ